MQMSKQTISSEATEILARATKCKGQCQGRVTVTAETEGLRIGMGDTADLISHDDPGTQALAKDAVNELRTLGLLEYDSEGVLKVSHEGYLLADEFVTQTRRSPIARVK